MSYTAIVDYGVGNLKSVTNAMRYLGLDTCITGDEAVLERADAIILPGVGAFPDAAERLRGPGLDRVLVRQSLQNHYPLFQGLEEGAWVYFVHSFCGVAEHETDVIARTEYGPSLVAAVSHGNVYGCQFHPEKSGEAGLQILRNFGGLNR